MSWRWAGILFLSGLGISLLAAAFQDAPGYMDADYYYAEGLQLATGQGWNEPFLWNYLDEPEGLPHPAFTYWMPLASLIAAAGMRMAGATGFDFAQTVPIFLAGLIPPLTAWLAYSLNQQLRASLLAGLLAVLPGFYLPFQVTTDTFAVCMILGIIWLQLLYGMHASIAFPGRFLMAALGLGLTAGLIHLARADGLLWLAISLFAVVSETRRVPAGQDSTASTALKAGSWYRTGAAFLVCLAGYLLVMGGWLARNQALFGTLLSPAGSKILWITAYDEIYSFPASVLTPLRWWSTGLGEIIQARLWALGQNLQTVFAVQGEIFLAILVVPAAWAFRRDVRVRWGLLAFVAILASMTLIFPFQGGRGGLFHSGATLQPLWWALAPAGLEIWLRLGEQKRGWRVESSRRVLTTGLVALVVMLTGLTTYARLVGSDPDSPAWGRPQALYRNLEVALGEQGAGAGQIALVNNPPGFFAATGREAIPVPDGDLAQTLAAARRYRASFLLLERDHPDGLAALYQHPTDRPGLLYLATVEGTHLFEVLAEE